MRKYEKMKSSENDSHTTFSRCTGHCARCPHIKLCPARSVSSDSPVLLDGCVSRNSSRNQDGIGFALDVGSTTLAGALYNLRTGKMLSIGGAMNPQTEISADVIARIAAAETEEGLRYLRSLVQNAIEKLLDDLCGKIGIRSSTLSDGVVTGNTPMLHILFGHSPEKLGKAPFRADWLAGCGETLLSHEVWLPPCIGAFAGADLVCALVAAGLDENGEPALLCDIGTNAEIAVRANGMIFAASAAAGPAFEGTGVRGSELLDAIAEFLSSGAISKTGFSTSDGLVLKNGGILRNADVRAVQMAKAAVAAGIATMLAEAEISPEKLKALYLAGGFGCALNPDSAVRIGMLPPTPNAKKIPLGNAALSGAAILLLHPDRRSSAIESAHKAKLINLGGNPDFSDRFINAMMFA